MTILCLKSLVALLYVSRQVYAIQVSPNSPCSSVCLDDPSKDPSDPNSSSTTGSDIVCRDAGYTNTAVGRKYQACVSCLQNSTSTDSRENDQAWFLYNLRYTLSSCLFGFSNVTDAVSTPCSTSESCEHLQKSLENDSLDPNHHDTYSYCSANDNAFLGSYKVKCTTCLASGEERYLRNFMTALEAGCVQKAPAGTRIGLDGTVFSTIPVNITFPGDDGTAKHRKGLSKGGIIGISVSAAVFLAIVIAVLFVCFRKYQDKRQMKRLRSPLDSRFGAENISAPTNGAYGSPYPNTTVKVSQPFDASELSVKERQALGLKQPVSSRHISQPTFPAPQSFEETRKPPSTQQLPPYSPPGMPTHRAYIPTTATVPESPVTSIASNGTYQMSALSTPNTSPKYTPSTQPPPQLPLRTLSSQSTPTQTPFASPRISPPPIQPIQTELPPRTKSRAEGPRRVITKLAGGGSNSASFSPVDISGPIVSHGRRFDFEASERDRREQELQNQARRRKRQDMTPESAESQEQWPGSY
ncbi:hypothetical protein B0O99DRAFT_738941 [Bisporella sp. PMI_857]|nr:hypothetical protein B0O99DRAFT_738941 [Bisporella sp. PMI_857]